MRLKKSLHIAGCIKKAFHCQVSIVILHICSTNSTTWNAFICCSAIFTIHMSVFSCDKITLHSPDQNHLPTYFELSAVGEEVHVHICSNLKFQNSRILRNCQLESSSEWHLDFYLSLVIIWSGHTSPYLPLDVDIFYIGVKQAIALWQRRTEHIHHKWASLTNRVELQGVFLHWASP